MEHVRPMKDVRSYGEDLGVHLGKIEKCDCNDENDAGRYVVIAYNDRGYNYTTVDLVDLINWVRNNKPELLDD